MAKEIAKKGMVLIFISVLLIILIQLPTYAGSFSISAGKTTMTTGETTTCTLSVVNAVGKFKLTSSDTSIASISGDTSPLFDNPRKHVCNFNST